MKTQFAVRVGKFDDRKGPFCIYEDDINWNRICVDALGIEKENITFEENEALFRVINIKISNSSIRGGFEKYSVIIKHDRSMGNLKEDIIGAIKSDFIKLYSDFRPDHLENLTNSFCRKYEKILSKTRDVTDISEKESEINYLRNKTSSQSSFGTTRLADKPRIAIIGLVLTIALGLGVGLLYFQRNSSVESSPILWIILSIVVAVGIIPISLFLLKRKRTS